MLLKYAPMAELADAPDLGSGVPDVKVQVLSPVPKIGKLQKKSADFYFSPLTFLYDQAIKSLWHHVTVFQIKVCSISAVNGLPKI